MGPASTILPPRPRLVRPVAPFLGPLLLLASLQAAAAAQEPPRDLGPLLEELRAPTPVPAVGAALVTREEGVVALGVAGTRAAGDPTPVRRDDPWHLGSCTKAMTATLVARCVEQGHLAWDTTLAEVFGEELALHGDWRAVTVLDLLTHRSGADANPRQGGLWFWLTTSEDPLRDQRRRVAALLERPAPGERGAFLYSNTGYTLAGAVLEQRLDRPFEELLAREVFEPLGMDRAGFGAPGGGGDAVDAPRGHRRRDGRPVAVPPGPGADNPAAIAPAGTVHAPLADWAAFVRAHLAGAAGDEGYLSSGSWQRLHEPVGSYAPGWVVGTRPWAGGETWTHAGSNTMWYCVVWAAPGRDCAILVTTNLAGEESETLADAVALAVLGEAGLLEAPATEGR